MSNTFINPFTKPLDSYVRNVDPINQAIEQATAALMISSGDCYEKCNEFVKRKFKESYRDPVVTIYERAKNEDKHKKEIPLSKLVGDAIKHNLILAPTLTTYLPPRIKRSLLSKNTMGNIVKRKKFKNIGLEAKQRGDMITYEINNGIQNNKKTSNNSLSGAQSSTSTPLSNKSAHSSLTSTCRSTSGYGNANNERLIGGNRHYWSIDVIFNNITSIVTNTDYNKLGAVMLKYRLKYPTTEDVMSCITYSSMAYVRSVLAYNRIRAFVTKLTPIQKAAFVYTGDMYHIRIHNEEFMRSFIYQLSKKVEVEHPNPVSVMGKPDSDLLCLVSSIFKESVKGIKPTELNTTEVYGKMASTMQQKIDFLMEHADFIEVFFLTTNVPPSVAYFPQSMRRVVMMSDTDSTIFTVQEWNKWYFGDYTFTEEGYAVDAAVIYITAMSIIHILALMSTNLGVEVAERGLIAMKNEFKFDVFIPTQVAKHYFALISAQEGLIFKSWQYEIKGVHLKSSNVPKEIMSKAHGIMKEILETVVAGKKISLMKYLKIFGDDERKIIKDIKSGSSKFFKYAEIKQASAYTTSESRSNYSQYTFWNEVFGAKYGFVDEPPYKALKINVDLKSPTVLREWMESIEDKELVARLKVWLEKNSKKRIGTLLLPESIIRSIGIPDEFNQVIGVRKMVVDLVGVYYIILECLGIYMLNKKITRIVSDEY